MHWNIKIAIKSIEKQLMDYADIIKIFIPSITG